VGQTQRKGCSFRGLWCHDNETQNYSEVAEVQKECNERVGDELAGIKKQTTSGENATKKQNPADHRSSGVFEEITLV
jgi:pyruvate-formate lyase-activating enzyme